MRGLTLDTGALIALERARKRIREVLAIAQAGKDRITVPVAAIAKWVARPRPAPPFRRIPGRGHHTKLRAGDLVRIEPELWAHFGSAEAVNDALRKLVDERRGR